jgi:hypothetical protein
MRMDADQAVKFANATYENLREKMKIDNRIRLQTDIKEIQDRTEEVIRKAVETKYERRHIDDLFDLAWPNEVAVKSTAMGRRAGSFYEPKRHMIYVTLYNSVNGLMDFNKALKNRCKNPAKTIKEFSAQANISGEIGHALRDAATGAAGADRSVDGFVTVCDGSDKIVLLNWDDTEAGLNDRLVKEKGLSYAAPMHLGEFFEPIGVYESAELWKGTPYAFKIPYDADELHEQNVRVAGSMANQFNGQRVTVDEEMEMQHMLSHQAALMSIAIYEGRDKEKFRKEYVYGSEPVMKWNPKKVVDEFFSEHWKTLCA